MRRIVSWLLPNDRRLIDWVYHLVSLLYTYHVVNDFRPPDSGASFKGHTSHSTNATKHAKWRPRTPCRGPTKPQSSCWCLVPLGLFGIATKETYHNGDDLLPPKRRPSSGSSSVAAAGLKYVVVANIECILRLFELDLNLIREAPRPKEGTRSGTGRRLEQSNTSRVISNESRGVNHLSCRHLLKIPKAVGVV